MQTGKANEEINKNITKGYSNFNAYMIRYKNQRFPLARKASFSSLEDAKQNKNDDCDKNDLEILGCNFTVIHE